MACKGSGVQIPSAPPQVRRPLRRRPRQGHRLANLPFDLWRRNAVWLELVLVACDLTCWAQALLLDGTLARAEPKTLHHRPWHTAARVVRHARRQSCACSAPGPGQQPWPARSSGCELSTCAVDRPGPIWPCPAGSRRPPWPARGTGDATRHRPGTSHPHRTSQPDRQWTVSTAQPTLRYGLDGRHQRLMKRRRLAPPGPTVSSSTSRLPNAPRTPSAPGSQPSRPPPEARTAARW